MQVSQASGLDCSAQESLRDTLFFSMGADGVYGRSALYEGVLASLNDFISGFRPEGAEVIRFPPVMSRHDVERQGYLKGFPNLLGCACALHGSEADIRRAVDHPSVEWHRSLQATELVLSPAACYPLYPIVAARQPVPDEGWVFDVAADCFRREPSKDLDRLQSFRMREYVCLGAPHLVGDFRARWLSLAQQIAEKLTLPCEIEQASDPFFGRVGQMRAVAQMQQAAKFELLIPFRSPSKRVACMSFNAHRDHFCALWDIRGASETVVHSSCVAFGLDRLTLALFVIHGLDLKTWPLETRQSLGI